MTEGGQTSRAGFDGKPERPKLAGQMSATVAAKWREDLLDEGYTPVPKRLIRCLGRLLAGFENPMESLAVILAIVDYKRAAPVRAPSAGLLAFTAGMTEEVFLVRLTELEARGYVHPGRSSEALDLDLRGLYDSIKEFSNEA